MDNARAFDDDRIYDPDTAETGVDDARLDIGGDERRMHVRAYNHWVSLLYGRPYPSLADLEPANITDFGPYSVLLSADVYTQVSETTVNGYPIREHLNRLVDGEIIWAPAIDGAFVLSTRGGDFDLQLGTDVSIGYLSHDADSVQLYLQETLTFLCYTAEASVALGA